MKPRRTLLQLHAEAAEWFHENLVKTRSRRARAKLSEKARDRSQDREELADRFRAR